MPDLGPTKKQKIKTETKEREEEEESEQALGPIKGFMASRFELENEIER